MDRSMHRRAFGKASAALGVASLPLLGAVSRPCIAEAAEAPDALPLGTPDPSRLRDLLAAFGAATGDAGFDPALDLDSDGVIGATDLILLLQGVRPPSQDWRLSR